MNQKDQHLLTKLSKLLEGHYHYLGKKLDKDMMEKFYKVCGLSVNTEGSKQNLFIIPMVHQGILQ